MGAAMKQSYGTWLETRQTQPCVDVKESSFRFADFVKRNMAPAFGFDSTEDGAAHYLQSCTPADPAGCAIPTLELFTYNDGLIAPSAISELRQLYVASPHIVTAVTHGGTHMIRWQGWRLECWLSRASHEFLDASLIVE